MKGMMLAAKYARENKVPYLGICLGMQISVIEFARSVSDLLSKYCSGLYIRSCIEPASTKCLRFWVWKRQIVKNLMMRHPILL